MRRIVRLHSTKIVDWVLLNKPRSPRVFSRELKKFEKASGLRLKGVIVKGRNQTVYYNFFIVDRKQYIFFKLKNTL